MIFTALYFIKQRINEYLKTRFTCDEDMIVLSSLANDSSSNLGGQSNYVIMTLINLEKELSIGNRFVTRTSSVDRGVSEFSDLYLNLYIMISTHFDDNNYEESLKVLSSVVEYVQSNQVFNHFNSPELSEKLDQLTLEIVDLDFNQMSQVWNMIGSKYTPSIMYKMRMITIESNKIDHEIGVVGDHDLGVNN